MSPGPLEMRWEDDSVENGEDIASRERKRSLVLASPLGGMNWKKGFLLLEMFGSRFTSPCAKIHEFLRDIEKMQIYMPPPAPNVKRAVIRASLLFRTVISHDFLSYLQLCNVQRSSSPRLFL